MYSTVDFWNSIWYNVLSFDLELFERRTTSLKFLIKFMLAALFLKLFVYDKTMFAPEEIGFLRDDWNSSLLIFAEG